MVLTSRARKLTLTAHVTSSVGWFGAVAAFLALSIAGLTSANLQLVRAAYLSMELMTWFVIVPLSVAALLTGLVESLGTTWGLFRHYWVIAKLGLTVLATIILLVHTQPIGAVAAVAADRMLTSTDLRQLRIQLIADAAAALLALLVATTLSVYKPWAMSSYGRRVVGVEIDPERQAAASTLWTRLWIVGIIVVLALFIAVHIISGGVHQH
jgi:hypothetical protein